MAKYGKTASKTVESAMHRRKQGTLRSSSGQKVTDPKQAIAIGLSEAREKGGKVPPEPSRSAKGASKRSGNARGSRKRASAKRSAPASRSTAKRSATKSPSSKTTASSRSSRSSAKSR